MIEIKKLLIYFHIDQAKILSNNNTSGLKYNLSEIKNTTHYYRHSFLKSNDYINIIQEKEEYCK